MKWKHFPRYWPFVNSPHKGQWRRALVFSLICAWINGWVNNRESGDLIRHRDHYDVTVMIFLGIHCMCMWKVIVHDFPSSWNVSKIIVVTVLYNNMTVWNGATLLTCYYPGTLSCKWVTKALFINFLRKRNIPWWKNNFRLFEPLSYLTGVAC